MRGRASGSGERLPSALLSSELWQAFSSNELFVFLDFDGTLAPIVERPEWAAISEETRSVLRRLVSLVPTSVISGRDGADVERLVAIPDVICVGGHGWDPPLSCMDRFAGMPTTREEDVSDVAQKLRGRLADVRGVEVEQKRHSVVVHVRRADAEGEKAAEDAVAAAVGGDSRFRVSVGKRILEVLPATGWNKGSAVLALLGASRRLPLYLGDDRTDEDAFRAIRSRGVGILVAEQERETAASYRLRDPGEVRCFLDRLVRVRTPV